MYTAVLICTKMSFRISLDYKIFFEGLQIMVAFLETELIVVLIS